MSSVLALGAPYNSFVDWFTFVCRFFLRSVFFHFLCIRIKDRNRVKTNGTSWKHYHTLDTVHDLNSVVLCEVMVAFEFGLFWVDVDFLWQNWVNLWGFAVGTVESESLCEVFPFPFDLNCQTFLIELMSGDSTVNFIKKPLVNVNESTIKGLLLSSETADHFGLLWEGFEVNTDQGYFFDIAGFIEIILQNDLRFLFISKQQYVIDLRDTFNFLPDFLLKEFKIILRVKFLGIQKSFNDSNIFQLCQILNILFISISVIISTINKRHKLLQIRIGQLVLDHLKVILSEVPQLHYIVEVLLQSR